MDRYLTRIGKPLQSLAMSHAVPAGSREVIVVFNFISERTVLSPGSEFSGMPVFGEQSENK
jgi:hypothetical protein